MTIPSSLLCSSVASASALTKERSAGADAGAMERKGDTSLVALERRPRSILGGAEGSGLSLCILPRPAISIVASIARVRARPSTFFFSCLSCVHASSAAGIASRHPAFLLACWAARASMNFKTAF